MLIRLWPFRVVLVLECRRQFIYEVTRGAGADDFKGRQQRNSAPAEGDTWRSPASAGRSASGRTRQPSARWADAKQSDLLTKYLGSAETEVYAKGVVVIPAEQVRLCKFIRLETICSLRWRSDQAAACEEVCLEVFRLGCRHHRRTQPHPVLQQPRLRRLGHRPQHRDWRWNRTTWYKYH